MQSLPWLTEPLRQLTAERSAGRLPHALLITGQPGLGKLDFARLLAGSLLCEQPAAGGTPCGNCKACKLVEQGVHPDLSVLTLLVNEKQVKDKQIKIDAVRKLCNDLALTSHSGGYKVAIITPADTMNNASANALLKTLEEPTDNTLLILVTNRPGRLLPTIRSRCRRLVMQTPDRQIALDWLIEKDVDAGRAELILDRAKGAPLTAQAIATGDDDDNRLTVFKDFEGICLGKKGPLSSAAGIKGLPLVTVFGWMQDWITDMIRLSYVAEPPGLLHRDLRDRLELLAQRVGTQALYGIMDELQEAQRLLDTTVNAELLLEGQLLELARTTRAARS